MIRLLPVTVKRIVAGEVCRKFNDIRTHGWGVLAAKFGAHEF
jgi:hypothetical protein